MLALRPKLILQLFLLLIHGGVVLGDSKKSSTSRQLSADSKPSIDSTYSDLFESKLEGESSPEDSSVANKDLHTANKGEVKAEASTLKDEKQLTKPEVSTSKAEVDESEETAAAGSDSGIQTGLLTTAAEASIVESKADVEAATAGKGTVVSSSPSSPALLPGSSTKAKRNRRKDSGPEMVSLDAGFRDDHGKAEKRVVPLKEIQEHVREEGDSKDGLLTEYGLIFLISAASLGIVAASLLGLSVAFSKNSGSSSKSDNCITRCCCFMKMSKSKVKKTGSSSSKWGRSRCVIRQKSGKRGGGGSGTYAPRIPRPDETSKECVEGQKYSIRALADSFVGSIRSMTGSLHNGDVFSMLSTSSSSVASSATATSSGYTKRALHSGSGGGVSNGEACYNAEDSAWSVYHTEEGIPYYYNALTGKTSWEPPENVVMAESFTPSSSTSYYSSPINTCRSVSQLP